MKRLQKLSSAILTVVLFLNLTLPTLAEVKNEMSAAFPTPGESGTLLSEDTHVRTDIPPLDYSRLTASDLLGEDTARRTETGKTFLLDHAHGIATDYGSRVHKRLPDGSYSDIDNTLILAEGAYRPKDGAFELELPAAFGGIVKLREGAYPLAWQWQEGCASEGVIRDTVLKEYADNPFYLPKLISGLDYPDAFESADVSVTVNGLGIKENVIIKSPEAAHSFSFVLDAPGLSVKQQDPRTLVLTDEEGKAVYLIEAPELRDAAGAASDELTLEAVPGENGTVTVTLAASEEWLRDESRVYPVTLDPYIHTAQNNDTVTDTYVESSHPNTTHGGMGSFFLGKEGFYGSCRILLQFELPALSKGDTVVDAKLTLTQYAGSEGVSPAGTSLEVAVYRVTTPWNAGTATWNNMASHYDASRIYETATASYSSSLQRQDFYITGLVRAWYSGEEENNGVMLRWPEDTGSVYRRTHYFTSNFTSLNAYFPLIYIRYLNDVGLEEYRSYHSASAGPAGTAYVNDYNGNLSFAAPVSETDGLLMPVVTGLVYNGYLAGRDSLDSKYGLTAGKGWTFDLSERIDSLESGWTNNAEKALFTAVRNGPGSFRYVYRDTDATVHYLWQDGSVYRDEEGLSLELSVDSASTAERYRLGYKDGSYATFDSNGYLTKRCDAEGNAQTVSYTVTGSGSTLRKLVTGVTDGAGRVTTVTHDANNRISSVTAPGNRTTVFTYDAAGRLASLSYPNGLTTVFTYDSENRLIGVQNRNGTKLCFSYSTLTGLAESEKNKVRELRE